MGSILTCFGVNCEQKRVTSVSELTPNRVRTDPCFVRVDPIWGQNSSFSDQFEVIFYHRSGVLVGSNLKRKVVSLKESVVCANHVKGGVWGVTSFNVLLTRTLYLKLMLKLTLILTF